MRKIIFAATILLLFAVVYSCSKNSDVTQPAPVDPSVTYAKDIGPIMTKYCTSCHGSAGGVNLSTQANVVANYTRVLATIQKGSMPTSGSKVTSAEFTILKSWNKTS